MRATRIVQKILSNYEADNPGVKGKLCSMLMHGKLGGTGRMIILPVDQGFEHGPARSFAPNPPAYDPHYHYQLAIDAGLNAFAAPLGMLEAGAGTDAGQIPTILKANSANSLIPAEAFKDQAITASVDDALRLGCAAIGFTIYPGSAAVSPSLVSMPPRGYDHTTEAMPTDLASSDSSLISSIISNWSSEPG